MQVKPNPFFFFSREGTAEPTLYGRLAELKIAKEDSVECLSHEFAHYSKGTRFLSAVDPAYRRNSLIALEMIYSSAVLCRNAENKLDMANSVTVLNTHSLVLLKTMEEILKADGIATQDLNMGSYCIGTSFENASVQWSKLVEYIDAFRTDDKISIFFAHKDVISAYID